MTLEELISLHSDRAGTEELGGAYMFSLDDLTARLCRNAKGGRVFAA
jgi:hypothetical protein